MDFLEIMKIAALVAAILVLAKYLDEFLVGRMKRRREEKEQQKNEKK